jgi:YHS domain-containing protein
MKLRYAVAALLAPALLATVALLAAEDAKEEKAFKATCPVSGQPAIEDSSVAYRGKKVYFCCENCPNAFTADPDKFAAKANRQLLETGQMVQVACPLTGRPCAEDKAVETGGVTVHVCCAGCLGKAKAKEGDVLVALLFADTEKGFTLQTECPVSGKPIDPAEFVEHEGKKVYFCCPGCPAKFTADPEKYLSKLPQFAEEAKTE